MAKILVQVAANAITKIRPNDIVSIHDDDHVFSPAETASFRVKSLPGFTADKVIESAKEGLLTALANETLTKAVSPYSINLAVSPNAELAKNFTYHVTN